MSLDDIIASKPKGGRGGGGGGGGGSFGWEELDRWLRELSPEEARQVRERLLSELRSIA